MPAPDPEEPRIDRVVVSRHALTVLVGTPGAMDPPPEPEGAETVAIVELVPGRHVLRSVTVDVHG